MATRWQWAVSATRGYWFLYVQIKYYQASQMAAQPMVICVQGCWDLNDKWFNWDCAYAENPVFTTYDV